MAEENDISVEIDVHEPEPETEQPEDVAEIEVVDYGDCE